MAHRSCVFLEGARNRAGSQVFLEGARAKAGGGQEIYKNGSEEPDPGLFWREPEAWSR